MPVWHAALHELRAAGDVVLIGITQEQHPDRCRLFAQWQGFDWPILWDPFNLSGASAVPIVSALDEHGVVRGERWDPRELEGEDGLQGRFLARTFADPGWAPTGRDGTGRAVRGAEIDASVLDSGGHIAPGTEVAAQFALATLLYQRWNESGEVMARATHDAVATLDAWAARAGAAPSDEFRAGVARRLRYDSPYARAEDFQASLDLWARALSADPNQYIWRRRIQQWGPRLEKPYSFYGWVDEAARDIAARGERPTPLEVPLAGNELDDGGVAPPAGVARVVAAPRPRGADWPRWRGLAGDNVSPESEWSAQGATAPLWSAEVGVGYSTPVIAGGAVFCVGYVPSAEDRNVGYDRVVCLDLATGAERWTRSYPAFAYANEHRGGALSTPTVSGDVLLVASRQGELRALDVATGAVRYAVDLAARHGLDPGRYGFASSPFVDGERVILNLARTVALDLATGDTRWVSENLDANYSTVTPIALPWSAVGPGTVEGGQDVKNAARRGYVVFGGEGLCVVAADDGSVLRRFTFRQTPRNVEGATPIVLGTDVFISSGYDQGAALVDMAADPPTARWRSRRMRTKLAGATLFDGYLYGHDESMLTCMDLTGDVRWRERGLGQGALSIAGGRLLVTTSEGELVVAEASPDAFVELSRTDPRDAPRAADDATPAHDAVYWATPVLAHGRVFVRGSTGRLVCLDHRAQVPAGVVADALAATDAPLPTPAELERRHLERSGLAAHSELALTMEGTLHVVALGLEDVRATWGLAPGQRWFASFDLPAGMDGTIHQTFDGEHAWEVNPYRGDKLLTDSALVELRRSAGERMLCDPLPDGADARTVGFETWRGVSVVRVDVLLSGEAAAAAIDSPEPPRRSVYFDAETGLYVGRSAADEATVLLGDWRPLEGAPKRLLLPFRRTTFESETGLEHRWTFTRARLAAPDAARFSLPSALAEEVRRGRATGAERDD